MTRISIVPMSLAMTGCWAHDSQDTHTDAVPSGAGAQPGSLPTAEAAPRPNHDGCLAEMG